MVYKWKKTANWVMKKSPTPPIDPKVARNIVQHRSGHWAVELSQGVIPGRVASWFCRINGNGIFTYKNGSFVW